MFSRAIAKVFLALNVVSFLAVSATILYVLVRLPPPPLLVTEEGRVGFYLIGAVLFVLNLIAHGLVALAGAFLSEIERIRRAMEGIIESVRSGQR